MQLKWNKVIKIVHGIDARDQNNISGELRYHHSVGEFRNISFNILKNFGFISVKHTFLSRLYGKNM